MGILSCPGVLFGIPNPGWAQAMQVPSGNSSQEFRIWEFMNQMQLSKGKWFGLVPWASMFAAGTCQHSHKSLLERSFQKEGQKQSCGVRREEVADGRAAALGPWCTAAKWVWREGLKEWDSQDIFSLWRRTFPRVRWVFEYLKGNVIYMVVPQILLNGCVLRLGQTRWVGGSTAKELYPLAMPFMQQSNEKCKARIQNWEECLGFFY